MKVIAIISLVLALFALIFPIVFSAGNPIEGADIDLSEPSAEQQDTSNSASAVDQDETTSDADAGTTLRLKRGDNVIEIAMDDYLTGVVSAEMPASFELEALKAQAVAARTYTMYKMQVSPSSNHPNADVCDDSACCKAYKDDNQLHEKWGDSYSAYIEKISNAVSATDGQYIAYENQPILAVFHSSSTGKTEASENVWGTALPYLVPVDSMEDSDKVPQYESTVTISPSNFKDTVSSKFSNASFSDDESKWISNTKYSDSGRLLTAEIGGVTVTGTELRTMFELRSTGMDISITDDGVVFSVTGYGHGVGMSQYGANAMAANGRTYDEILSWYYTGTTLAHT